MKEILEYQWIDSQVYKLEREKNNLEEKNIMNKMISFVKDAQNKSFALEEKGKSLFNEYNSLKNEYNSLSKEIQSLVNVNIEQISNINQVDDNLIKANFLSSQLFMVERNINIIITKIRELLKNFEQTKNTALKARAKHKEAKENLNSKVLEIEPKINNYKLQLKELEKKIDPKIFEKYKTIKSDGIFPVFVKIKNSTPNVFQCGGCGMDIPKGKVDKLKNDGFIVCEQCRRIIINE